MSENIFNVKDEPPNEARIQEIIKDKYLLLDTIRQFIRKNYGETNEEWKYYGVKNGWVLKTFLKKRNLFFISIYDGYFSISFVFGDKAVTSIIESNVTDETKKSLKEARKYAEGRGISFEVHDYKHLDDIKKLIKIKVS
ncbi:MAG: DUF3788 family protein [Cyclobacteriaceae bacterium]|jgi:hypothetical protein